MPDRPRVTVDTPPARDHPPAAVGCLPEDHHWVIHIRGGEPISIQQCDLCQQFNWADLRRQIEAIVLRVGQQVADAAANIARGDARKWTG